MDENIISALRTLTNKLSGCNARWVLIGSANLALPGVEIEPSDIDVLTDEKGAHEINMLLKEHEVSPVRFSESDIFRSHFGEFHVNGVRIEVIGEMEEKIKGEWRNSPVRLDSRIAARIGGMDVHLSPLNEQLDWYEAIAREKDSVKAEKIREFLEKHRIN